MKRFIFLSFSLLTACSLENDYYMNDYGYQPPPSVRVERPYYPSSQFRYNTPSSNFHGHSRGTGVYQPGHGQRNSHGHGHGFNPPPPVVQNPNVHGHPTEDHAKSANNTHGHFSESYPSVQARIENPNNNYHSHD